MSEDNKINAEELKEETKDTFNKVKEQIKDKKQYYAKSEVKYSNNPNFKVQEMYFDKEHFSEIYRELESIAKTSNIGLSVIAFL